MTDQALGRGAGQAPALTGPGILQPDFVSARQHVGVIGFQPQFLRTVVVFPAHTEGAELEEGVIRHVEDGRIGAVDRVALRFDRDAVAQIFHHVLESMPVGLVPDNAAELKILAQVEAGEGQGAAGVFLLGQAEEIGGVTELGFHLFLAVPEIVVGNQGDHHALPSAAGDLEGGAVVVEFVLGLPAHAVAFLPVIGLGDMGETHFFFRQGEQLGRQNHTAGVAGPFGDIQPGVILRQHGIAGIAEDAFHEIEVGHHVAGGKEPGFHGFASQHSGHLRHHQRAEQQGDPGLGFLLLAAGERELQQFRRGGQGFFHQGGKGGNRHCFLVVGNGESALTDMKDPFGGPPVVFGIMEHAILHAVAFDDIRVEFIFVLGQGEGAGQTVPVQGKAVGGEPVVRALDAVFGEKGFEVVVNMLIHRTQVIGQQPVFGFGGGQETVAEFQEGIVGAVAENRLIQGGQFDVDQMLKADAGGNGVLRIADGVLKGACIHKEVL